MTNHINNIEHLNIEVTGWCNQKCIYCFNDSRATFKAPHSQIVEWSNSLEKLKNLGLKSVHLTGGEPFGAPGILRLIEKAQKLKLNVSVLSNGFRVADIAQENPTLLKRLKNAQISLDSIDPKLLAKRRGHKNALKDSTSAISSLRLLDVPVEISLLLDDETVDGVNDVIKFAHEQGATILIRQPELVGRNRDLKSSFDGKSSIIFDPSIKTHDQYYYLPSHRSNGAELGIRTVTYQGKIWPHGIETPKGQLLTREDIFKLAA